MSYRDYLREFESSALFQVQRDLLDAAARIESFSDRWRYDLRDYASSISELQRTLSERMTFRQPQYDSLSSLIEQMRTRDTAIASAASQLASQAYIFNDLRSILDSYRHSLDLRQGELAHLPHLEQASLALSKAREVQDLFSVQTHWLRQAKLGQVSEISEPIASLMREAASLYADEIGRLRSEPDPEEISEDEIDSVIEVINDRIAPAFTEPSPSSRMKALRDFVDFLKSGTQKLKLRPAAQFLLANLLIELLGAYIAPLILHQDHSDKPRISEQIRAEIKKQLRRAEVRVPKNVRIVVADTLYVKKGAGTRNAILGQLYAGDVVVVLGKRTRSWSLVEYRSASGETVLRGWVFSRYLEPINNR